MRRPDPGHAVPAQRNARAAGISPALLPPADPAPGRTRSGHLRRDQLDAAAVIGAYRDQKLSLAQVAAKFGTSRRVMELMLAEHGIARRPPGRAPTSGVPA